MTVVCNSWGVASKEQGNSLSSRWLYLECSLCSSHADTHLTHHEPQQQADPRTTSLCNGANFLSSDPRDTRDKQPEQNRENNSLC